MISLTGSYSFLPWLRRGVASVINATDGDTTVKLRATIRVDLQMTGAALGDGMTVRQTVGRDIQLFGPGDIVGIDGRAIIRTEPRHWVTNFEPNYLAAIDFYDEDLPWRYTPAGPDGTRLKLRPWIALVVLAEEEFKPAKNLVGRPLDYIEVANAALFPAAGDLWAWAHVHVNRSLAASEAELVSSDMNAVLPKLQAALDENPDLAYSRIICPRRLAEKTHYHAFVVPVFESGRLAGLNLDPAKAPHATASAWETYAGREEPSLYPVYYRWEFHTGAQGDFESLVRLLEAKPVDARVGTREMDVLHPGSNLPAIDDAPLAGVLKLGGALKVPRRNMDDDQRAVADRYENWADPEPHAFQMSIARFVNLADDYDGQSAQQANLASGLGAAVGQNRDPLLTAPLYGRWHALASRLLTDGNGGALPQPDNWVHELNLDPRFRVAAAFGTRVVQESQEAYMQAAWEQIGDVIEANRRIRLAQLARETAWTWHARHLVPLAKVRPERALAITAPAQGHVVMDQRTVRFRRVQSPLAPAASSVVMRRITRPGARTMRGMPFDAARTPANLYARINANEVSVAPARVTPPALPTVDRAADGVAPKNASPFLLNWMERTPSLPGIMLGAAVVLALCAVILLPGAVGVLALIVAGGLGILSRIAPRWARKAEAAGAIREVGQTPESVARMRENRRFTLTQPGSGPGPAPTARGGDSAVASRFKLALRDWFTLKTVGAKIEGAAPPLLAPVSLARVVDATVTAVDPVVAITRRVAFGIKVPPRFVAELGAKLEEQLYEIMAYPEIDRPMYKPLTDLSSELFLPNLNLVPPNSVTLLESNQRFIEAYMVGLNHEFARELLWREYPTDQRGSYFRQFWDVRGAHLEPGLTEEQQREKLRDIPPIHRWGRNTALGVHDNRGDPDEEELVLVIRGELLKKYPTAVIYAQAAKWQKKGDGSIDPSKERKLVELTAQEEADSPPAKLKLPLYEAKVEPDIYFFGFDLKTDEAIGGTGEGPADEPGWFFVIRERPGEPRFGFDDRREGPIQTVNDIAWGDAIPGGAPGSFLEAGSLASLVLQPLGPADLEKQPDRDDDLRANAAPVSAARWAYLLYQAPMMVAVHAAEMLRR
jgi:hypothetical protein